MDNSSNNNSIALLIECRRPQIFQSPSEFFICYSLLYQNNWAKATAGILLSTLAFFFNTLVIILLTKKQHINIFDQILIAHCIVDGVTGLVDVSFFHITDLFGYWPFISVGAYIWTCYDNAINVITNLHMLYMTWLRLRSITAPNTYEKEILARKPKLVILIIWATGFVIWIPVTLSYGLNNYSVNVDYDSPIVGTMLILVTWFTPLSAIIVLSITIVIILNKRIRQKGLLQLRVEYQSQSMNHTNVSTIESTPPRPRVPKITIRHSIHYHLKHLLDLGPQVRFQIIIISYCLQWFPSSLLAIIDPLCHCIPSNVSGTIYWLTYTVCLTDPLVILIFNPNVTIRCGRVNPH